MVDDRAGHIQTSGLLKPLPPGNAVHFEHEQASVARRQQIDSGVVGANGGCGASDNGCKGKNSCKGKGGCKTTESSCKGKNGCAAGGKR